MKNVLVATIVALSIMGTSCSKDNGDLPELATMRGGKVVSTFAHGPMDDSKPMPIYDMKINGPRDVGSISISKSTDKQFHGDNKLWDVKIGDYVYDAMLVDAFDSDDDDTLEILMEFVLINPEQVNDSLLVSIILASYATIPDTMDITMLWVDIAWHKYPIKVLDNANTIFNPYLIGVNSTDELRQYYMLENQIINGEMGINYRSVMANDYNLITYQQEYNMYGYWTHGSYGPIHRNIAFDFNIQTSGLRLFTGDNATSFETLHGAR